MFSVSFCLFPVSKGLHYAEDVQNWLQSRYVNIVWKHGSLPHAFYIKSSPLLSWLLTGYCNGIDQTFMANCWLVWVFEFAIESTQMSTLKLIINCEQRVVDTFIRTMMMEKENGHHWWSWTLKRKMT